MDVLCFLIENIYVILKQEENGKKIKEEILRAQDTFLIYIVFIYREED